MRTLAQDAPDALANLRDAARTVHAVMPATPQYRWPLLEAALQGEPGDGTELWLKHENHSPVGAFKIRGGLVYFERWLQIQSDESPACESTAVKCF